MNAPAAVVFPDHTTFEWSLAVSAFAIGGPGGAVLGGYLANKKGRRGAISFSYIVHVSKLIFSSASLSLEFSPLCIRSLHMHRCILYIYAYVYVYLYLTVLRLRLMWIFNSRSLPFPPPYSLNLFFLPSLFVSQSLYSSLSFSHSLSLTLSLPVFFSLSFFLSFFLFLSPNSPLLLYLHFALFFLIS